MSRPVLRIACAITLLVSVFAAAFTAQACAGKQVVGATEVIHVEEAGLSFRARVDTGAKTSSIHAERIEVGPTGSPGGKPISFYLVNKKGESRKVETHVASVATFRTSEGSERRYKVVLTFKWNGSKKRVLVSLNDREQMEYGLLLGRNWLSGDFLVDVDRNK